MGAGRGGGEGVAGPDDPALEERLGRLVDETARNEMREAIDGLDFRNGAAEAADVLHERGWERGRRLRVWRVAETLMAR